MFQVDQENRALFTVTEEIEGRYIVSSLARWIKVCVFVRDMNRLIPVIENMVSEPKKCWMKTFFYYYSKINDTRDQELTA